MPSRRQERVSERIHQELSELLQRRLRDPRLAYVTVTEVQVSPDLKLATIFVSALGDDEAGESALTGLQHASRYIRRELAQMLQMRAMPELRFLLDDSWERGARIDQLLEQLPPAAPSEGTEETAADADSEKD
ncbi:MAG: 30S ribosome-binding factor RbfA [Chloroflexi bacterium]|nr:30S ribosome-binding factor RbfA [Chloroflexota bacterium]